MSHIELEVVVHRFSGERINSFLSTLWSVLLVDTLWIIIADKAKLTNIVLHKSNRFDVTICREHLLHFLLRHVQRNIFHIDIVDESSESPPRILWLELLSLHLLIIFRELDSLGSNFFILEADESVPSGSMVRIERDFERLDFAD